jgi:hypothetical protein
VAAAVGLLGALASPAGASAATVGDPGGDVVVSSDGVSWGPQLSAPLFDPSARWVPGDIRTVSFYVRNGGAGPASLRIEGRDAVTGELTDERAVALFARADGGRWQRLRMGAMSGQLNVVAVPVGQVSHVEVRAVFEPDADNHSQEEAADLTFVVGLQDASATGPGGGEQVVTGHLPGVGAPEVLAPLATGAALVGTGVVLVGRRRVRHG